ncbi:MAG: hypothetical protein ABSE04_01730 [Candidatus Microgenomates bacterium]|jgi:predicted aspartyl protease
MNGYFDGERIYADIEIKGVFSTQATKLKGQIDTGYSGYLSLPFNEAFPLGLVLQGTQAYTLADGSPSYNFVCLGTLIVDGRELVIPVDVSAKASLLIGIGLLGKIQNNLLIDFENKKVLFKEFKIKPPIASKPVEK